jgi:hypothetical protein
MKDIDGGPQARTPLPKERLVKSGALLGYLWTDLACSHIINKYHREPCQQVLERPGMEAAREYRACSHPPSRRAELLMSWRRTPTTRFVKPLLSAAAASILYSLGRQHTTAYPETNDADGSGKPSVTAVTRVRT